jgi:hypothetical protein
VRRSKSGPAGQALQLFRRAYARKLWGLRGGQDRSGTYRLAAEALTAAGFPTKEQDFKNAKRIGDGLPEHAIPASDRGVIALIHAILTIWPEFEWRRMVDGTCADLEICAPTTPAKAAEMLESVVPAYEPSYALMHSLTGVRPGCSALADRPNPAFAGYTVDELERGWGICADQGTCAGSAAPQHQSSQSVTAKV